MFQIFVGEATSVARTPATSVTLTALAFQGPDSNHSV